MAFTEWVDEPQEWNDTPNLQWTPHIVDSGIVYPIKNFITNTKIPYMFITKNQEHIFESTTTM